MHARTHIRTHAHTLGRLIASALHHEWQQEAVCAPLIGGSGNECRPSLFVSETIPCRCVFILRPRTLFTLLRHPNSQFMLSHTMILKPAAVFSNFSLTAALL